MSKNSSKARTDYRGSLRGRHPDGGRGVMIRIAVLALVIVVVVTGLVLIRYFQKSVPPEELLRRAGTEIDKGELAKAAVTVKALERELGSGPDVRRVKSDLLTAEALAPLQDGGVGGPAVAVTSGQPQGPAGTPDDRSGAAIPTQQTVEKLSAAMELLKSTLNADTSGHKWQELLRFETQRLVLFAGSATDAAAATKLAERRLAVDAGDVDALKLTVLASVVDSRAHKLTTDGTQLTELNDTLTRINDPAFTMLIVGRLLFVGVNNTQIGPQIIGLARQLADLQAAAHTDDVRSQLCARWTAAVTDSSPGAAGQAMDSIRPVLCEAAATQDWPWLSIMCKAVLATDMRPVWSGAEVTSEGARTVSQVLIAAERFEDMPDFKLLAAGTLPLSEAIAIYDSVLTAPLARASARPDLVLENWVARSSARLLLIQSLVDYVLERPDAYAETERIKGLLAEGGDVNSLEKGLVQAKLMLSEGKVYPAAAAFDRLFEASKDSRAVLGKAEALLRAQEWGSAMNALRQARAGDSVSTRDFVRINLMAARVQLRFGNITDADGIVTQLERRLKEMPAVRDLREDVDFYSIMKSAGPDQDPAVRAAAIDARLASARTGSPALNITRLLYRGRQADALAALREAPLDANLLVAWKQLLPLDEKYETLFYERWQVALLHSPLSPARDLMAEWVDQGLTERLLAAGDLLTAARDLYTADRLPKIANAALALGTPPRRVMSWIDNLQPADQARLPIIQLRCDLAAQLGDWDALEKYSLELEHLSGSPLAGALRTARRELQRGNPQLVAAQIQPVTAEWPFHSGAQILLGLAAESLTDNAAAEAAYLRALEIKPDSEVALAKLFGLYTRTGRGKDAMEVLRKYRVLYPGSDAIDDFVSKLGQGKESLESAIQVRRTIADRNPRDRANLTALADLYEQTGRIEESEGVRRALVAATPNLVQVHVQLAAFLARHDRNADAEAVLQGVMDAQMARRDLDWLAIAAYYRQNGDSEKMESAVRQALAAENPDRLRATPVVGQWYFVDRRYQEALPLLVKAWGGRPLAGVGALLAECHLLLGDNAAATQAVDAIIAIDPDWRGLPRLRAQLAMSSGQPADSSIALMTEAIKRWPTDAGNYLIRARLQRRKGAVSEAILDYQSALRYSPGDGNARLELGELLLSSGQTDQALAVMEPSKDADLTHPVYRIRQAMILLNQGEFALAKKKLASVKDAGGADVPLLKALADVYEQTGEHREAAACMRKLLPLLPEENAVISNNLAYHLAIIGETDEAVKIATDAIAAVKRETPVRRGLLAVCLDTLAYAKLCGGDIDGAVLAGQETLATAPFPQARLNLAQALLAQNKPDEALAILKPLSDRAFLTGDGTGPGGTTALPVPLRLDVLGLLARTAEAPRVEARAVELLTDDTVLLERPEWHARLRLVLAEAQFRVGHKGSAIANLRQSISTHESVPAHLLMAEFAPDNAALALGRADVMLKAQPDAILQQKLARLQKQLLPKDP